MPITRVRQYLTEQGVSFSEQEHDRHVTAQEVAEAEHFSGWRMAKPVMLWADGTMVMAVVPAATQVDLDKARSALGADHVRLAQEPEFVDRFPDCESGAEPPFGHLYDVDTYLDSAFPEQGEILFRAGTHTTSMVIDISDLENVTKATRVDISVPR